MADNVTNLVDLLENSCRRHADRRLFGVKRSGAWHWTRYGEFARQVDDCRAGLAALGVRAGDRVGIIAKNRIEWAVVAYAVYGLRAALVPMFEVQRPDEWRFILGDCSARVVVCGGPAPWAELDSDRDALPALEHVVGLDLDPDDSRSYAALLRRGADAPRPSEHPEADEVAGIIYTSGTTGRPKGVVLSHGNFCSNVNGIHELLEFQPDDVSLCFLPWAHSFGQTAELHDLVSTGSALAINDDVANLVANLAEVRPTVLFAVPRIFNRIYAGVHHTMASRPRVVQKLFRSPLQTAPRRARGQPVGMADAALGAVADRLIFRKIRAKFGGRLKYTVSGSAALNHEVAEFVQALGIAIYEGYGLTETSPVVSSNAPGRYRLGSVGRPLPGVRVSVDTSRTDDPEQGEVIVQGPNVMRGYYNCPEEDAVVFTEDGALRTGDMGRIDADGYLYITGRIKEQYKLENGKYVVPSPLEEELKLSPYIANVMLYGANRPHNVALVVPDQQALRDWAASTAVELADDLTRDPNVRALIEREIAQHGHGFKSYEKPRRFALVGDDFTIENGLLTPSLKVKRREVCARYESMIEELFSAPTPD